MISPRFKQFQINSTENVVLEAHSIAYTEWGDETNPQVVICAHGMTRNSRDFDYLASHLSSKYRVICPDMPGRGQSSWLKNPQSYNYVTYVTSMLSFLKYLGKIEVYWIGTSMGGIIGMMIAANKMLGYNPIAKLMLNDIGPYIPISGLLRISKYVSHHPHFATYHDIGKYLKIILSQFGITKESDWQHLIKYSVIEDDAGGFTLAYDPAIAYVLKERLHHDIDLWAIWNEIITPILILRGKDSDILPELVAIEMVKSKKNVTLVELDNIGHAPSLMTAEQIYLISNWLGAEL